jgi:hypothetical protein
MSCRPRPTSRRAGTVVWLALTVLVLTSCATSRPTVDTWEPIWKRVSEGIPSEATVSIVDPDRAACSEALTFLRSNRSDLFPTPDLAIDDAVADWVEVAEGAFFECPPRNQQIVGFAEAYEALARLQGEIELVLDMDR